MSLLVIPLPTVTDVDLENKYVSYDSARFIESNLHASQRLSEENDSRKRKSTPSPFTKRPWLKREERHLTLFHVRMWLTSVWALFRSTKCDLVFNYYSLHHEITWIVVELSIIRTYRSLSCSSWSLEHTSSDLWTNNCKWRWLGFVYFISTLFWCLSLFCSLPCRDY